MMPTAKMLTPGVFHVAARKWYAGETPRALSVAEAKMIAERVCTIADVAEQMAAIRSDIERITGIKELTT